MPFASVIAAASVQETDLGSLLFIAAIAAGVPLLVGLLNLRIAEVVFLIAGGIIVGPAALDIVEVTGAIELLADLGLGFLFFFAGYELDRAVLRGATGRLALTGWVVSVALAAVIVVILYQAGVISDELGVAIALTSTALGTLLPLVRDSGRLESAFGRNFMAAGAIGEFGPVIAIALLLGTRSSLLSFIVLIVFFVMAILVALLPRRLMHPRVLDVIERGHHTSSQTAVRIVVLLLVTLLALAGAFQLDIVLGAFAAGIIVRLYVPKGSEAPVEKKLEAIAFGLFIPLFFVVTGVKLDVQSIIDNPWRMVIFFILLLVVRGLPQMIIYRRQIPAFSERAELSLFIATALPIIVAVTTVQVDDGAMKTENAAALVGAGALSVLAFPLAGQLIARRRSGLPRPQDADPVESHTGGDTRVE